MNAPTFSLPDQDGNIHSLSDYKGKWVLLYFYPKDDTPGCTKEACGFRDMSAEYKKNDIIVLGVSKDSVASHKKFAEKYHLNFPLLSDESKKVHEAYGAWGLKKMMGREYMGTMRNSYLIDPAGKLAKEFKGVDPLKHPQQVLDFPRT